MWPHHRLLLDSEAQLRLHALLQRPAGLGPDPLPALRVSPSHLPTAVGTWGGQDRALGDQQRLLPHPSPPTGLSPSSTHVRAPPRLLPPSTGGSDPGAPFASSTSLAAFHRHSPLPGPATKATRLGVNGLTRTRGVLSPTAPRSPRTATFPAPAPSHLLPLEQGGWAACHCHGQFRRDPTATPCTSHVVNSIPVTMAAAQGQTQPWIWQGRVPCCQRPTACILLGVNCHFIKQQLKRVQRPRRGAGLPIPHGTRYGD